MMRKKLRKSKIKRATRKRIKAMMRKKRKQ
jgi:hypothetical protein